MTRPAGSLKCSTTRENIRRHYTPNRLIRSKLKSFFYVHSIEKTLSLIKCERCNEGPVVRKSINVYPRLKVNRGFYVARLKGLEE